jgi:hypothetical protein
MFSITNTRPPIAKVAPQMHPMRLKEAEMAIERWKYAHNTQFSRA